MQKLNEQELTLVSGGFTISGVGQSSSVNGVGINGGIGGTGTATGGSFSITFGQSGQSFNGASAAAKARAQADALRAAILAKMKKI